MGAPRKWSTEVRKAIHELVNEQGHAATDIAPMLRDKGLDIPPLESIRDIARAQRTDITEQPRAEQLRQLVAGIVKATNAEISRVQGESNDDAPDQLLKLAKTIREIEPLLSEKPQDNGQGETKGTLGVLGKGANANTCASILGPVTARATGSDIAGPQSA